MAGISAKRAMAANSKLVYYMLQASGLESHTCTHCGLIFNSLVTEQFAENKREIFVLVSLATLFLFSEKKIKSHRQLQNQF